MTPDKLTAREHSFATPKDLGGMGNYRRTCRVLGLHPISGGWGFLHCLDEDGGRWTAVTSDVEWLRMLVESGTRTESLDVDGGPRPGVKGIATISEDVMRSKFPKTRKGWPDDWATS